MYSWLLQRVNFSGSLCCNTQTAAGRLKGSVNAQSKLVGPKKQQKNVATGDDALVKDEHNQERKTVAEKAFNDDERTETGPTVQLKNDATKTAVIVLVSDDDLSDGWEDYPKPDPVSSRREKGHSKCVVDRKGGGGEGAKTKFRGTPPSTKPRLPRGKRQSRAKRASLDSTYLRPTSGP